MLDEVVVVGYGSMKRSDVATAISSVKPEDMNLAGANSRDVRQLLDGKVAGLSITRTMVVTRIMVLLFRCVVLYLLMAILLLLS